MKNIFENKKQILLLVLIFGLVVLGGWKYFELTKPIDIGNPKKVDFVKVGKMSVPRWGHETVLLDDGTVLVFGGKTIQNGAEIVTNTADLYDPKTKQFTPVGNMLEYREDFTATKLKNGKILITGGENNNKSLKSTEFYNPKTKIFEQGPDMNFTRLGHTTTLLQDGRVLIAGGEELDMGRKELPLAWHASQCEIYDPIKNKFNLVDGLKISRINHSAILLKDGRVLIVGGVVWYNNGKANKLSSAELYNPKTNKNIFVKNMNFSRVLPILYFSKNGNVLVTSDARREIELFNPKTNEFIFLSSRALTGDYAAEVLLNDDTLLFTGGSKGVGLGSWWYKTSEIFDPKTGEFRQGKDMNFLRTGHRATLLEDGNVLITGSEGKGRTAELYINK